MLFEEIKTVATIRKIQFIASGNRQFSCQEQTHTKIRKRVQMSGPDPVPPTRFGDSPFLTADQDDTPSTMGRFLRRGGP